MTKLQEHMISKWNENFVRFNQYFESIENKLDLKRIEVPDPDGLFKSITLEKLDSMLKAQFSVNSLSDTHPIKLLMIALGSAESNILNSKNQVSTVQRLIGEQIKEMIDFIKQKDIEIEEGKAMVKELKEKLSVTEGILKEINPNELKETLNIAKAEMIKGVRHLLESMKDEMKYIEQKLEKRIPELKNDKVDEGKTDMEVQMS